MPPHGDAPAAPAAPDGAKPTTAPVGAPGTDNATTNAPPDNAMVVMIIPPDSAMSMWNDGLYVMRKTGPFLSLDIEEGDVIAVQGHGRGRTCRQHPLYSSTPGCGSELPHYRCRFFSSTTP